jgi:hypothetical protein
MSNVVQENVLQVRFQAVNNTSVGQFKVMTVAEVDDYFSHWTSHGTTSLMVGSNTMSNNAFQILTHHWVHPCGDLEAWYVTVHPAF